MLNDGLQHGVAVAHPGGAHRRVRVDVCAHAVGREAQGGDVVAALAEDDGKGAVHAIEVPATVRVDVAHHAHDFPLAVEANLNVDDISCQFCKSGTIYSGSRCT